jgi:hypothetical protein
MDLECPHENARDGCISKHLMDAIREVKRTDLSTPFDQINLVNYIKNIKDPRFQNTQEWFEEGGDISSIIDLFSMLCPAFAQNVSFKWVVSSECQTCKNTDSSETLCFTKCVAAPSDDTSIKTCIMKSLCNTDKSETMFCNCCGKNTDGRSVDTFSELPKILIVHFDKNVIVRSQQFRERLVHINGVRYEIKSAYILTPFGYMNSKPFFHATAALFDDGLREGEYILVSDDSVSVVSHDVFEYVSVVFLKRIEEGSLIASADDT